MSWCFLEATDDCKFVTSDNPLFYISPSYNAKSFDGKALKKKDVQVTFPISKDLMLFAEYNISGKNFEQYIKIGKNDISKLTRRTVISALRFVYSSEKSRGINNLVQKHKDSKPKLVSVFDK